MGHRIRKGTLEHRRIEARMQTFFADPANGHRDPETGTFVVEGADTFRRAADYVSGRSPGMPSTLMQVIEAWDPNAGGQADDPAGEIERLVAMAAELEAIGARRADPNMELEYLSDRVRAAASQWNEQRMADPNLPHMFDRMGDY